MEATVGESPYHLVVDDLYTGFHIGFILWAQGSGRKSGSVVMRQKFLIGTIDRTCTLPAAYRIRRRSGIIRNNNFRHPPKYSKANRCALSQFGWRWSVKP